MSYEAVYNPLDPTVPNVVTAWSEVDLPTGNANTINSPDISQVNGIVTVNATKLSGNAIVPFTAQDTTNWNAVVATATNLQQRSSADSYLTTPADLGKLERARDTVIANEFNTLIAWMSQTNTNIAAATSLSDLKARQTSNQAPSAITLASIKTAILNQVDLGNVD